MISTHARRSSRLALAAIVAATWSAGPVPEADAQDCPLTFGSLSSARTAYPITTTPILDEFRAEIAANFSVSFVAVDSLLDPEMSGLDVLWINIWEIAPQAGELTALMEFIEAGGTVLMNANLAYNSDAWLAPLGLETTGPTTYHATFEVATSTDPQVIPIVAGPYGTVSSFQNSYVSRVQGLTGSSVADAGVVQLEVDEAGDGKAVLALVPRFRHGLGQALVVTNFHVFQDEPSGFMDLPDTRALLLNLMASAICPREEIAWQLATTIIPNLDLSLFTGPNSNANAGRRGSLANRAHEAYEAIGMGDFPAAIELLTSLLEKIDGEPHPGDWIIFDSAERADLALQVSSLIDLLAS